MESFIGDESLATVVSGVDLADLAAFALPPFPDVYIGDGFITPQPEKAKRKISNVCIFILFIYQGDNLPALSHK